MPTCFVIQPFDAGKFDKRFDGVYRPAVEAAGLEAYRVDRDPSVDVPIDAIEEGIRNATICLADITTDNPNVWYELGFAFATGRPVVTVCSKERPDKKYPFDIQHRTIISYGADAPSDFEALKDALTARIKALLTKSEAFRQIEEQEQVSPIEGVTQPELYVLAEIAGSIFMPQSSVALYFVKDEITKRQVLTGIGFSLGLHRLITRGFVQIKEEQNYNGDQYSAAYLTDKAWGWIETHEELFVIRRPSKTESQPDLDDGVPF
jgi:hypothetical protein